MADLAQVAMVVTGTTVGAGRAVMAASDALDRFGISLHRRAMAAIPTGLRVVAVAAPEPVTASSLECFVPVQVSSQRSSCQNGS